MDKELVEKIERRATSTQLKAKDRKAVTRGIVNREFKLKNGNYCKFCGCHNELLMTVDHKLPLSRGGADSKENKQVMCHFCNILKGSLTDNEFLVYYKSLVELVRLNKMRILLADPPLQVHFIANGRPIELENLQKKTETFEGFKK